MENILGTIYGWFKSFYNQELDYFLWGWNPNTPDNPYSNTNFYNHIGLITLVISVLLVILFYYIVNHPRFCKWWSWLLTMLSNGIIALLIGFGIVYNQWQAGNIPADLLAIYDENGQVVTWLITSTTCWGFGIANMFVAMIAFVLFSFMLKWWSSSAKHVPFL